jgi:hypothetical protein
MGHMTIEELEFKLGIVDDKAISAEDAKLDARTPEVQALWKSLARDAQIYSYSTPLFSLKKTSHGDVLRLAGSGTFLAKGSAHYILTAGHVWHEALKCGDYVGVTLREVYDHTCLLEVAHILTYEPDRPAAWNEWGPDLILLRIPDVRAGEIKAFKAFYEMQAGLRSLVTLDRNETYLLVGTPSVLGSYTQNHASVQLFGMWVGTPKTYTHNQWDYFDVEAALRPPSDANTFGGVSGGGLWRVQIYSPPGTDRIESVSVLEGVAFYELGTSKGEGIVRCHGLQSIQTVLDALPKA